MANRMRRSHTRKVMPRAEGLETRQLLSAQVTGTDIDGDTWVLDLQGPGDLSVVQQAGADGFSVPLGTPGLIREIMIAGTAPLYSRLLGTVTKGPNGDGKVFFANMTEQGGDSLSSPGENGLLAIDIPDFWQGDTEPTSTDTQKGTITILDGVITFRFGGVDTTAFFGTAESQRLDQNGKADNFDINLGLPQYAGTTIIVDRVVTSGEPATSTTGDPILDTVSFNVGGRLNTFQANAIEGNADLPPAAFSTTGGTIISSQNTGGASGNGIPGQIGDVRIGGDATNLAITTDDRISNVSVGGEARNISINGPRGLRNVVFGRGMDTVNILTHVIETLSANRGAINSRVLVERDIGRVIFGGDAVDTQVLSGYVRSGSTIRAQLGGGMTVLVAGDVTDSIFAASVQPIDGLIVDSDTGTFTGIFGNRDDLEIPKGHIDIKVEGAVNNSNVAPGRPGQAAFADLVRTETGPVNPPNVPEPPYHRIAPLRKAPGVNLHRFPTVRGPQAHPTALRRRGTDVNDLQRRHSQAAESQAQAAALKARAVKAAITARSATPKGPLGNNRSR